MIEAAERSLRMDERLKAECAQKRPVGLTCCAELACCLVLGHTAACDRRSWHVVGHDSRGHAATVGGWSLDGQQHANVD